MEISVILDNDMLWSEKLISELFPHAQMLGVTESEAVVQKELIEKSAVPIPVIHPHEIGERENYRLVNSENDWVGIITLLRDENIMGQEVWEIITLVFEKFRGNDISPQAKRKLFNMYPSRNWIAVVYKNNKWYPSIRKLLIDMGFIVVDEGIEKDCFEKNASS